MARPRICAIFADYDSCFDVVNPLIQQSPASQKYSRAFFEHWGVIEIRDGAVELLDEFLTDITSHRDITYLFVASNRQSLAFDKILGGNSGGFEAIGGGAYEAIAAARDWTLNYTLVADTCATGTIRLTPDGDEGSAWKDVSKRQPIEPGVGRTKAADDMRLKLLIVENNFRQLLPQAGDVDVYFFDDRQDFLTHTRENATIPTHVKFHTVRWDFMGYIVDGWTRQSHPLKAMLANGRLGVGDAPRDAPPIVTKVERKHEFSVGALNTEQLSVWLKANATRDSVCELLSGEDIDGAVILTCTDADLEGIGIEDADDRLLLRRLVGTL